MTVKETVKLIMKSSDHNPYFGKLSKEDNIIAAIDVAKLCLDFADKGCSAEAMDLDSDHWKEVISELETKN